MVLGNQNKNREFKKRSFSITKVNFYNDLDGPYGSILDFDTSSADLALIDHFFDVENYAYYDYENIESIENINTKSECENLGIIGIPLSRMQRFGAWINFMTEIFFNNANNAYNADEKIEAYYGMIDVNLPSLYNVLDVKLITGLNERYNLYMSVYNSVTDIRTC